MRETAIDWESEYKSLKEQTSKQKEELKSKIQMLENEITILKGTIEEKRKEYEACTNDYIKIKEEKAELESKVTKLRYTIKNIAELL